MNEKTFIRLISNNPKIVVTTNDPTLIFIDGLKTLDISHHPLKNEITRNPDNFAFDTKTNTLIKIPITPPSKNP